jgi:hypothetical protein
MGASSGVRRGGAGERLGWGDLGGDALAVLIGHEDLQDVPPLLQARDADSHGSLRAFEGVDGVEVDLDLPVCGGAVGDGKLDYGAIVQDQ